MSQGASLAWGAMQIVLVLMIGLRHDIGGDWWIYLADCQVARNRPFSWVLRSNAPAYFTLKWLAVRVLGGIYTVNLACGLFFVLGLAQLCQAQPRPWLALVVSLPYLVTMVAMGYTRQSVAIGLAMGGLVALGAGQPGVFVAGVGLATLFHRSALLLLPLVLVALDPGRAGPWLAVGVLGGVAVAGALALGRGRRPYRRYLDRRMVSGGVGVRLLMLLLPAAVVLVAPARLHLAPAVLSVGRVMAWGVVGLAGAYFVVSSSTAIDRLALYGLPLQVMVLARLPETVPELPGATVWLPPVIAGGAALVLLVWLRFGANAYFWLPYRCYPLATGKR